jgi:DNA-binding NtrC family response regulator
VIRNATIRTRPKLIALDSDLASLHAVADTLEPWFDVLETRDARKALAWLQQHAAVRVIVAEHVMDTAAGVSILETVRTLRPDVRRVMLTGHADLSGIIHGLHTGAIDRLVHKPFTRDELLSAVRLDAARVHAMPAPAPAIAAVASQRASA